MQKNNYEVDVLINGKPAKEYLHKKKVYIEGREETTFSLRLRNNSYQRKLFVPTIDGLSVLDGKEASFKSGGYIVPGYSTITVDGWRINDDEVASFYFSSPDDSYRKRMKKGNNLGVIGVAVFDEKQLFTTTMTNAGNFYVSTSPNPFYQDGSITLTPTSTSYLSSVNLTGGIQTSASLVSCSYSGSAPTQQLGTGWGTTKTSEVVSVDFTRFDSPTTVFEINYNTRAELEKAGISFKKEPLYVTPQAFPGNYCQPPRD